MANYDGSIRIITEISTEMAKKSLGTLSNTIVKTAKEISSLRSKMDALKGQKFYTDDYKKLQSDLATAEKELAEFTEMAKNSGELTKAQQEGINKQIEKYGSKIDSIKDKMQELEDSGKGFTLGENTQEYANLERQKQYEEEALRIATQHYQMAERLNDPYGRLSQALSDLNGKLSSISRMAQIIKQSFSSSDANVSGYERWNSALEELKGTARRVSESVKQSFLDIKENGMSAIVDMTNKMRATLISKLGDALDRTSEKIGEILMKPVALAIKAGAAIKYAFSSAFEVVKEKAAGLAGSAINAILHPFQTLKSVASTAVSGTANVLKTILAPAMESIKARAAGVAATIINGIAHPFQTMKTIASKAISATSKLLSGMASIAKKVGSAIKSMASSVLRLGKNSKKAGSGISGMGMGFKTLLKYGLGIRSLYTLFNKFRTAVKEGFSNLAQYSAPVNAALSSLKSALTQLKNSLATAFAPILTAIAPALTTLINLASRAATAVGMLIAALTGQKSFVKATAVQEDYAASLGNTASGAKEAEKALEGYLSPIDEINKMEKPDTSSANGGGGGGGGAGVGDMFETVDIPSKISDLAKMIKDAWEKADFTEIGSLIGTKLKDALDNIPWDKIQATAAKVGKSLATLINGFVEVDGLGYSIGNTIAQAINTGLIGLEAFAKNLHWDSVGKFVAEGINGALINIDWNTALSAASLFGTGLADMLNNALTPAVFANIGYTIGMGLNTALTLANNFLTKFEWHNFGSNIGNGLGVAIETIDWESLGDAVANLLNAFFDTFGGIAESFPWSEFGSSVGNSLSEAISKFRWSDAGTSIGKFVSGLFETLKSFIDKTDWKELGKGITNAISSFWGNINWGTVSGSISSFAIGIFNFLTGLIKGVDWSKVPQAIIDGISDFFSNFDYKGVFGSFGELVGTAIASGIDLLKALGDVLSNAWDGVVEYFSGYIEESGGNIIQGLWNGIIAAISNIGNWIYDNIFSPFIEGFKSAFGIHSPSTVMEEQGNFIIEGLINGITALIDSVVEKFTEIKDKILEKFELVKTGISTIWNGITSYLSEKWEIIKVGASTIFENIKESISEKWELVKAGTATIWDNVSSYLSEKWELIKTGASTSFGKIKDTVSEKWSDIKSNTSEKWDSIKEKVSKVFDTLKSKSGVSDTIKDTVVEAWEGLKSKTKSIWDGIKSVIKTPINAIIGFINSMISGIVNGMNSLIRMLNKFSIDIPDNPITGAVSLGINIPELSAIKIPALATGAVIPPNKEFLAVLGDQKHGTNIEAPLSTIEQAVENVLNRKGAGSTNGNGMTIKIPVILNGKQVYEAVITEAQFRQAQNGRNPFATI